MPVFSRKRYVAGTFFVTTQADVHRYALFVGRMQLCETQVRAIESTSDRLRAKLGELHRKGLVSGG